MSPRLAEAVARAEKMSADEQDRLAALIEERAAPSPPPAPANRAERFTQFLELLGTWPQGQDTEERQRFVNALLAESAEGRSLFSPEEQARLSIAWAQRPGPDGSGSAGRLTQADHDALTVILGRPAPPRTRLTPEQRIAKLDALSRERRARPVTLESEAAAEEFLRNIDANRMGARPLFPPEKKGVTW